MKDLSPLTALLFVVLAFVAMVYAILTFMEISRVVGEINTSLIRSETIQ